MKPKEARIRIEELEQIIDRLEREIDDHQRENDQLRQRLARLTTARRAAVHRGG